MMTDHTVVCTIHATPFVCNCDFTNLVRADERAKADFVITFWEQENNSLRAKLDALRAQVKMLRHRVEVSESGHEQEWVRLVDVLALLGSEPVEEDRDAAKVYADAREAADAAWAQWQAAAEASYAAYLALLDGDST